MKRIKKRFMALIITFIVLIIAFVNFAIKLTSISLPPEFSEFKTNSVSDTSYIYENIYGIPHLLAKSEEDLFFLIGYIHARDRLWQMDFMRRTAYGQTAEILGKEYINLDKYIRSFNIKKQSFDIYNKIDENIKKLLESYSNGINFYIEDNYKRLPFEFAVLNYIPENWKPVDCIAIQKLIALKSSSGFVYDLILGEIADKIGGKKALNLIAQYPPDAPCVLDYKLSSDSSLKIQTDTVKLFSYELEISKGFLQTILNLHNYSNNCGSNTWVRKKSDSLKSGAILSSDPHNEMSLPIVWYQMHISCPTINAIGLSIPGIPVLLIGRNDYIAWGLSQSLIDDCDLFFEKISDDSASYLDNTNKQKKFKRILDTIKVRNSEDNIYTIIQTDKSSIINFDNTITKVINRLSYLPLISKYYLTYLWTGSYYSDEISCGYKLLKAKNWQQFKQAFNNWGTPSYVFSYADINGNIGLLPVGYIPIRNKECNNFIPNPGWLAEYSWSGFQKAINIGEVYNPSKKYVFSANNKVSRTKNIPGYYANPSRAIRIDTLLKQFFIYTSKDAQNMSKDIYSPNSIIIHSKVIPILDSLKLSFTPNQLLAYEMFKQWDGYYNISSVGAAIFSEFLECLSKKIFLDDLGEELYENFSILDNLNLNKINELINSDSSYFIDDCRTQDIENKNQIICQSFIDALDNLVVKFNREDVKEWKYGKMNILSLNHFLNYNTFLKSVLSKEPTEIDGSLTTINYSEIKNIKNSTISWGVSARFVADMEDTTVFMILPTGNSGHPHSPNYFNQFRLWYNGNFISLPISRVPNSKFKQTVVFFPRKK